MTTKMILRVEEMDEAWIKKFRQSFQGAKLEISIIPEEGVQRMNEEQFWQIIDLLAWEAGDDDDAILAPAVERLQQFSEEDIFRFQDILAEKLFLLDTQAFAEQLGEGRFGGDQHFSVDVFLYARACVVANGQAFFRQVLQNPAKMPKEYTFEAILYLAQEAFERKTGQDWTYLPQKSYETFSNREGWGGKSWLDSIL